ncbi:MAG: FtsX-like permease family protein, partial [Candidatus Odinarchaeota archaeon]
MSFIKRKPVVLFWLSRTNLKYTIISIFGLVIALSMLFGVLYNTNFARQELFFDLLDMEGIEKLDLESNRFTSFNYTGTIDHVRSVERYLEQKIDQYGLSDYLSISSFFPSSFMEDSIFFQNTSYYLGFSGHTGLNETILEDCVLGSQVPSSLAEILVYAPENTSLSVGNEINVTLHYYTSSGRINHNMTFTVAGLLKNSTIGNDSYIRNYFDTHLFHGTYKYDDYFFFTSLENLYSLIQQIKQDAGSTQPTIDTITYFLIDINIDSIDRSNVVRVVNSLNNFVWDLNEEENRRIGHLQAFYVNPIYDFNMLLYDINNFFISFTLISSPVLVLVVVLVFFSLDFVNEKRKKAVALLMARGVSNRFIFLVLSIEAIFMALLATTVSTVTGVILSWLIASSSGFLSFNREITFVPIIDLTTLLMMVLLAIGMTVLVHMPSIVRLSRSPVQVLEQEATKKKKRKTGRLRSQTDTLLLFTGLAGLITLDTVLQILRKSSSSDMVFQLFSFFIFILLFFSPLLVLIGSIESYNRFIAPLIYHLGHFFWKKNMWLLSVAMRNLNVNVKTTARATLLVAIAISFLLFIAAVPQSFMNHHEDTLYYDYGSDINLDLSSDELSTQETVSLLMSTLSEIDGIYVTRVQRVGKMISVDQGRSSNAVFLGISSNFTAVSHWRNFYDDQSLEELVSALYNATEYNAVIVDSRTAREETMTMHENNSLIFNDQSTLEIVPVAVTNFFPGLINKKSANNQLFVCKDSFLTDLVEKDFYFRGGKILVKIDPERDALEITAQIRKSLGGLGFPIWRMTSVPEILAEERDSIQTSLVWLIVNYNFITALITAITAVT